MLQAPAVSDEVLALPNRWLKTEFDVGNDTFPSPSRVRGELQAETGLSEIYQIDPKNQFDFYT